MGKLEKFAQEWFRYIIVLVIGLVVVFWTLNLIHTRAPGMFATIAGQVGARASGSQYNF